MRGVLLSGRFAELEDALLARVRELRDGRPLAPLTIVVGSGALRGYLTDHLIRGLGAVANISVVTLSHLATDVATRESGVPPRPLSSLVRERLVRRLVAEQRAGAGLRYFGPVSERPHFARALAATFEDLRQARVEPRSGWAAASARPKAADLEQLYAAYCAELTRLDVADDAAVLAQAARAVAPREADGPQDGAATPGLPAIILYGLYDLNEAQAAFVGALLAAGADLFVPWPRGGGDADAPALRIAGAAGLAEWRRDPPPPAGDLDHVAAAFSPAHTPGSVTEVVGDRGVAVVSVSDERGELTEAVREVLAALGDGGAAGCWECALVVPHADDVERFAAGLVRAGLPVACRRPDHAVGTRLVQRLLDCMAPAAGKPFSRRSVLDLFAVAVPRAAGESGPFAGSALWADEARKAGVVCGLDQWTERLRRRCHGHERRLAELVAGGEAEDDEDGERVGYVRRRLTAARGLEAAAVSLAAAFADLPERAGWSAWADWLSTMAARVFERELAVAVTDVVGRLRSLAVVDEAVGPAEMAAVLREQLAAARVPVGRVGREGVAVLTPLDLRGVRFHTVVVAGLSEGGFPARGRPDPILGDTERRQVSAALGVRLPLAEARDAESVFLFALACEAARARLVLIVPRTEAATGRPRLPSRLLLRLASSVAGHPVGLDEFLSGAPLRPVWRRVAGRSGDTAVSGGVWIDARERDVGDLLTLGAASPGAAGEYLRGVLEQPSGAPRRLAGLAGLARPRSRPLGRPPRRRGPGGSRGPRSVLGRASPNVSRALSRLPLRLPSARRPRPCRAGGAGRGPGDRPARVRLAGARDPRARLRRGHRPRPEVGRGAARGRGRAR